MEGFPRICRTIAAQLFICYELLVRRREALILDKVTNLFEHGSLPVRKTEAHLMKPAGQVGSNDNPEGDHVVVLFWYITLKIRRRCVGVR